MNLSEAPEGFLPGGLVFAARHREAVLTTKKAGQVMPAFCNAINLNGDKVNQGCFRYELSIDSQANRRESIEPVTYQSSQRQTRTCTVLIPF